MLNTAALIITSSLMMIHPMTETALDCGAQHTELCAQMSTAGQVVSYEVTVDTPEAELEKIQSAAEKAGLGFDYRYRGIQTRLVITMVYEHEQGYELKRITVTKKDGAQRVQWKANEQGLAIGFTEEESAYPLTQK